MIDLVNALIADLSDRSGFSPDIDTETRQEWESTWDEMIEEEFGKRLGALSACRRAQDQEVASLRSQLATAQAERDEAIGKHAAACVLGRAAMNERDAVRAELSAERAECSVWRAKTADKGESARTWKARAEAAEAEVKRLCEALSPAIRWFEFHTDCENHAAGEFPCDVESEDAAPDDENCTCQVGIIHGLRGALAPAPKTIPEEERRVHGDLPGVRKAKTVRVTSREPANGYCSHGRHFEMHCTACNVERVAKARAEVWEEAARVVESCSPGASPRAIATVLRARSGK